MQSIRKVLGNMPAIDDSNLTGAIGVTAVGVFDTVSSLGIPNLDFEGHATFDFSICDTVLNDKVAHGFHALAADEMRDVFAPTFWTPRANVEQEIFPGGHSDIGGGNMLRGLSDCTLDWMAGKLNGVVPGLFNTAALGVRADFKAPSFDSSRTFPFYLLLRRARAFPHAAVPSAILKSRLRMPTTSLPGTDETAYSPFGRYADGSLLCP